MAARKLAANTMWGTYQRWNWNKSGLGKLGLKSGDVYRETPQVKEALRRLPEHLQDERNFRIIRAVQCSMNKTILPEDQWLTFDDEDFYLQPYLDEIEKEEQERLEWAKK